MQPALLVICQVLEVAHLLLATNLHLDVRLVVLVHHLVRHHLGVALDLLVLEAETARHTSQITLEFVCQIQVHSITLTRVKKLRPTA